MQELQEEVQGGCLPRCREWFRRCRGLHLLYRDKYYIGCREVEEVQEVQTQLSFRLP